MILAFSQFQASPGGGGGPWAMRGMGGPTGAKNPQNHDFFQSPRGDFVTRTGRKCEKLGTLPGGGTSRTVFKTTRKTSQEPLGSAV